MIRNPSADEFFVCGGVQHIRQIADFYDAVENEHKLKIRDEEALKI